MTGSDSQDPYTTLLCSTLVVFFSDARLSFLFCKWVGCMTLIFHLGVETRTVRPVVHRLLTSVWKLYEVFSPRSAIHPRFRVPEIVSFWILDFIHVLVTWRGDGLGKNKHMSQVGQERSMSFILKEELTLLWLYRIYRVKEEKVGEKLRTLQKSVFSNLYKYFNWDYSRFQTRVGFGKILMQYWEA